MGANLARLEMRTVFERLLARFPGIEITGPLEWGVASPDQNGAATLDRLRSGSAGATASAGGSAAAGA